MKSTTTIHIIDQPNGGVMVYTTAGSPLPGQRLTPGQALASDLLDACTHRASAVRYWHGRDRALEFTQSMLDPERNGYSVTPHIRDEARQVLGLPHIRDEARQVLGLPHIRDEARQVLGLPRVETSPETPPAIPSEAHHGK